MAGGDDPGEFRRGQRLTVAPLNALRRLALACRILRVDAPLSLVRTPEGTALRLQEDRPVWGRLVGNSNPYQFVEVIRDGSPPTWADALPTEQQGPAWEANGAINLDGQAAWLWPDGRGGWDFEFVRQGGSPPYDVCFFINGCVAGLHWPTTIDVTQGGVAVGSCTVQPHLQNFPINHDELCCLTVPGAGTYDWSIAAQHGYAAASGSFVAPLGLPLTITLEPDSSHVCSACCLAIPVPRTLYLSTTWGTIPLVYGDDPVYPGGWHGCQLVSKSPGATVDAYGGCNPTGGAVSTPIDFLLQCTSYGWRLSWAVLNCVGLGPAYYYVAGTCGTNHGYGPGIAPDASPAATCDPFGLAFTGSPDSIPGHPGTSQQMLITP